MNSWVLLVNAKTGSTWKNFGHTANVKHYCTGKSISTDWGFLADFSFFYGIKNGYHGFWSYQKCQGTVSVSSSSNNTCHKTTYRRKNRCAFLNWKLTRRLAICDFNSLNNATQSTKERKTEQSTKINTI